MNLLSHKDTAIVAYRANALVLNSYSEPQAPGLLVEWGSITKLVTAHAASILARSGGPLSLDTPVESVLGWGLPQSITVRSLVNHSSGLPRVHTGMTSGLIRDPYRNVDEHVIRQSLASTLKDFPYDCSYSNLGYAVLGAVIARVTGRPWFDFAQDAIFDEYGMSTATLIPEPEDRVVVRNWRNKINPPWEIGESAYSSTGGVWSSMEDLARYGARFLSDVGDTGDWNGWSGNGRLHWHNGQTKYAGSCLVVDPEQSISLAVHVLEKLPNAADKLALSTITKLLRERLPSEDAG